MIGATCCVKSFDLAVTDIASNMAILTIARNGLSVRYLNNGCLRWIVIAGALVIGVIMVEILCHIILYKLKFGIYQFGHRKLRPTSIGKRHAIHRNSKLDNKVKGTVCYQTESLQM